MNQGGILACDLARWTGFCYGSKTDEMPKAWTLKLVDTFADARFCEFEDRFTDLLNLLKPTQVVIEAPLKALAMHTTLDTVVQQGTLHNLARMESFRASVPVFVIDAATVRRDILGRSYFPKGKVKDEVVRYCRRRGWRVPDHNAADACLLWLWYVRHLLGIKPVAGTLFAEMAA